MSTVTLRWVEGKLMVGTDSNGHSIVIGELPEDKKTFIGIKPSELLLLSVASCAAYDVIEILRKQRQPLKDLNILVSGEQIPKPPHKFTNIHLHYLVYGDVDQNKLKKAIRLAEDKYCSVITTLRPAVPITNDFEIIP